MSGVQHVTVTAADAGQRRDRWFRQHFPQVRHGELQKMLRKGQIRVGGGRCAADRRIEAGDVVRVPPLGAEPGRPTKKPEPLSPQDATFIRTLILHEDADHLVLNKPFGLAVQGGAKTRRHVDGMLATFGEGDARPRLVHRLDRDTGGVLVLARSRAVAAFLTEAFKQHRVGKTYWALTRRVPHPPAGRIDLALDKEGVPGMERMSGRAGGKRAITDYQVVETAGQRAAFVALRPHTGRTHQIRVHLSALGCPIVGDRKYGGADAIVEGLPQQMHLFCREMSVPRRKGPPLVLRAPLTSPMKETWAMFDFDDANDLEWPDD